jgi:hypothetical protein
MIGIDKKVKELEKWEGVLEIRRQAEQDVAKRNQEGLANYKKELSARAELNLQGQNTNFGPLGKKERGFYLN